jgi:hypothetical protein
MAITKGGAAGGHKDSMLQDRVIKDGEMVIKVKVLSVVVGNLVVYTYFFPTVWKQMNSAQTVFM